MDENKSGYVTIDEADEFISSHFLSSSVERDGWEHTTSEDKAVLLQNALESIENNIFTGSKTNPFQELSFPRNGSDVVPDDIKAAQIFEAVEEGFGDTTAFDSVEKGIKSETIGKIRTSYFPEAFVMYSGSSIKSTKVQKILNKYIKIIFDIQ